jgi:hypothetical protein
MNKELAMADVLSWYYPDKYHTAAKDVVINI